MKKWTEASIEELEINETAHDWIGAFDDGGRAGDDIISGDSTDSPSEAVS